MFKTRGKSVAVKKCVMKTRTHRTLKRKTRRIRLKVRIYVRNGLCIILLTVYQT